MSVAGSLHVPSELTLASGSLSVDGGVSLATLNTTGGSLTGAGTINVTTAFVYMAGSVSGTGTLALLAGATIRSTSSQGFLVTGMNVESAGLLTVSDGNVTLAGGASWTVLPGG